MQPNPSIRILDIMLVEDDEVDVMHVQRCFKKMGVKHRLHVFEDSTRAFQQLMDEAYPLPQVILLDINMPKMNGLELLARLRNNPRTAHLMVFMMSTSANQADRTAAYQNQVAGYIIKPLSATDFADSLQKLMRFIDLCAFP